MFRLFSGRTQEWKPKKKKIIETKIQMSIAKNL